MKRHLRRKWKIMIILIGLLAAWIIQDLFGPWRSDLRKFDPNMISGLETGMWKAYYNKESLVLYGFLVKMLHDQEGFPFLRANYEAYLVAKAAMVFKEGHNHNDYLKALPYLVKYFDQMKRIGQLKCNSEQAADKELEWWIVHRERFRYGKEALIKSVADAAAALYNANPGDLTEYAKARSEAMIIRDDKAAGDGVSETEWGEINSKLLLAYNALYNELNKKLVKKN